ncbi:cation-transporting ATPase E [Saccharothrix saharensis]|uniref:Cation-transporting ATPase E n=1 Tax=Saccharothrix saharensis TaxID=571190 RepID=A0A543J8B7_9PSEU|nr:HAD-IC family P-type ATPase [Saccharothrix saharensis]TQM79075.1 cation-transporting ATPase E [Saccharothrix saharensis]
MSEVAGVRVERAAGLTAAEVARRVAEGRTNAVRSRTSRSTGQIVRANVITPFNGLLTALFLVILATGRWQNGLFGLVVVANTAIGVVQELRAKRTLDRLAVLNAPRARVTRDGVTSEVDVGDVVADDLVTVRAGDQVVADGPVTAADGLEVDESLLTGESEPVHKAVGDDVRSGSIVVAGSGRFTATAVGADAYATRLTAEARRFTAVRSELVAGTNKLLRWISLMMLVVGPLLLWSQLRSPDTDDWQEAMTGAVAALVGMVPEGLVLLTSLAFMLAAVALARRQTLVQELPAVEVLARVDVVCLDKTGTLTHGDIVFDRLVADEPQDDVRAALALLATAPDANATSTALAEEFSSTAWRRTGGVPFSSARKWSSVDTDGHGTWVLGAPEMVFPEGGPLSDRAADLAAQGKRVLVLASARSPGDGTSLPAGLTGRALVVLAERIRDDAADTLRYFAEQGVALRVISGDNPRTVGAVAVAVGVPGISAAGEAVDARTLPDDPDALADVLEASAVYGRVTPQQKRAMVGALQRRGHVVAMTGDGVNDAMALKDADIGVAMGNGAAATRAVAQLVLLDSRFAHLPDVVAEGRRVIANIERAANLFLVKNAYSLVLALVVLVSGIAYPLAPIQLTMISALTIGIPGFVLALGPNRRRYVPGFLGRVLRLAVPTGLVIGLAAFGGDLVIRALDPAGGRVAGQTVATVVVLVASLWTLSLLARPLTGWKAALLAGLATAAAVVLAVPLLATDVFLLAVTPHRLLVGLAVGVVAAALVELVGRFVPVRGD